VPPSSDQDKRQLGHTPAVGAATTFDLVVAVDWVSPSIARDKVRSWLRAHRWSPSHVDDLVLAINEAVSNSIEHGYGQKPSGRPSTVEERTAIEVHGRLVTEADGSRWIEFTVRDKGSWLRPTAGDGNRGNGIRIMRACVEEVDIDSRRDGTTVVLRSRPMPPPLDVS